MQCLNHDTTTKRCENLMRQMERDLESRSQRIKDEQPANVFTATKLGRLYKRWRGGGSIFLEEAIIDFQASAPRSTKQYFVNLIVSFGSPCSVIIVSTCHVPQGRGDELLRMKCDFGEGDQYEEENKATCNKMTNTVETCARLCWCTS